MQLECVKVANISTVFVTIIISAHCYKGISYYNIFINCLAICNIVPHLDCSSTMNFMSCFEVVVKHWLSDGCITINVHWPSLPMFSCSIS